MKLIDYLRIHFDSMKQDQKDRHNYELGVRIYLISEYDFEDFIPIEYVSNSIKNHKNFSIFKQINSRFYLNKQAKKIFLKNFKFEHVIPKKFIIEEFYKCSNPEEFEKIIRAKLIHAFITSEEERRLPSYKGRNTIALALEEYKKAKINIERFYFDNVKK
jgi:hypothetical protein